MLMKIQANQTPHFMAAIAFSLLALPAPADPAPVPLTNIQTQGEYVGFWQLDSVQCVAEALDEAPDEQDAIDSLLTGSSDACAPGTNPGPGGFIELGTDSRQFDIASPQVLTGDFLLPDNFPRTVRMENLAPEDWTDEVIVRYVDEAIQANCNGERLPEGLEDAVIECFRTGLPGLTSCGLATIDPPPAERSSDPDLAYASVDPSTGALTVGLGGFLNAVGVDAIASLVPSCPSTPLVPLTTLRLSEVVKVTRVCGDKVDTTSHLLYGFTASPTNVTLEPSAVQAAFSAVYETTLDNFLATGKTQGAGPVNRDDVDFAVGLFLNIAHDFEADLNCDGEIDVLDVMATINLARTPPP